MVRACAAHAASGSQAWHASSGAVWLQGKPTECDRHNADVAIVHVLQSSDKDTPEEQLFDEFAAFFSARFPTDNVGDVRAFVAGVYRELKDEDAVCSEPARSSSGGKGRSKSKGRGKGGKRGRTGTGGKSRRSKKRSTGKKKSRGGNSKKRGRKL